MQHQVGWRVERSGVEWGGPDLSATPPLMPSLSSLAPLVPPVPPLPLGPRLLGSGVTTLPSPARSLARLYPPSVRLPVPYLLSNPYPYVCTPPPQKNPCNPPLTNASTYAPLVFVGYGLVWAGIYTPLHRWYCCRLSWTCWRSGRCATATARSTRRWRAVPGRTRPWRSGGRGAQEQRQGPGAGGRWAGRQAARLRGTRQDGAERPYHAHTASQRTACWCCTPGGHRVIHPSHPSLPPAALPAAPQVRPEQAARHRGRRGHLRAVPRPQVGDLWRRARPGGGARGSTGVGSRQGVVHSNPTRVNRCQPRTHRARGVTAGCSRRQSGGFRGLGVGKSVRAASSPHSHHPPRTTPAALMATGHLRAAPCHPLPSHHLATP